MLVLGLAITPIPSFAMQDTADAVTQAEEAPPPEAPVKLTQLATDGRCWERRGAAGIPWIAYLIPLLGVAGLAFTFWKTAWVAEQEVGTERMDRIAANISEGAMSFLKAEYSILAMFVVAVACLLGYGGSTQDESSSPLIAVSFACGAICSALAGFVGMKVATKANVRTTNAARTSLGNAFEVAFAGGSVMGMGVVGLGVLGLSVLFRGLRQDVRSGLSSQHHASDHGADRVFVWCIVDRSVRTRRWWDLYQGRRRGSGLGR